MQTLLFRWNLSLARRLRFSSAIRSTVVLEPPTAPCYRLCLPLISLERRRGHLHRAVGRTDECIRQTSERLIVTSAGPCLSIPWRRTLKRTARDKCSRQTEKEKDLASKNGQERERGRKREEEGEGMEEKRGESLRFALQRRVFPIVSGKLPFFYCISTASALSTGCAQVLAHPHTYTHARPR